MKKKSSIGIPTVIFVVFIVLKLCGVIAWPWLWVLAPLWIPLGIVGFMLFLYFVMHKIFR